jgi:hypothetical protein
MLGAILVSITVGAEDVTADSFLRSIAWEKRMLGASLVGSRLFKHPTNKATVTRQLSANCSLDGETRGGPELLLGSQSTWMIGGVPQWPSA